MRSLALLLAILCRLSAFGQIPLPEHPRPDWERADWVNLNGKWAFRFDPADKGLTENWTLGRRFPHQINVPFPWGSPLSGVADSADIAWYARDIVVPTTWKNKRPFLVIGASDYQTTVWLDGKELGRHEGGYTPFSFDISQIARPGKPARLVIRVDDKRREYALFGKQGYGNARGIWQTVYLEGRGKRHLTTVHFSPDIDQKRVGVTAYLSEPAAGNTALTLNVRTERGPLNVTETVPKGQKEHRFSVAIPSPRMWTLDDPYLYDATVTLGAGAGADRVKTYFGMRKISVVSLPGTTHPYVALNDQPVYLQLTLDQSYHPQGYYTFPSDAFMKDEIKRCKDIGLNGIRTHIKIDIPRKLYWADRLGLLVMSDLPNAWGQPDEKQRRELDLHLRRMIERDYNHPAIFAWIVFNETWGLETKVEANGKSENRYLPETQRWVVDMYRLAKSLDATRLVEDNSICCGRGHTETDINSWHEYLPGYGWEKHLQTIDDQTYPGSTFHFEAGYKQGDRQPNINSEFGNVWGYQGSSGDVDWSWDYHRAINAFRRRPKVAGWLYTEHHDVVNEWNGYWRYDRGNKYTGMEELAPGMTLADLHAPVYLTTGQDISQTVRAGARVKVPLFLSSMSGDTRQGDELTLTATLHGWDALGAPRTWGQWRRKVPYRPWMNAALDSLEVALPDEKAVAVLDLRLEDREGGVVHRNFVSYVVEAPTPAAVVLPDGKKARLLSVAPAAFSDARWSVKQWNVLDGLKVNGAGAGYVEYRIPLPADLRAEEIAGASVVFEASAKQLFGKDKDEKTAMNGDYMLGGGAHDPSRNPNAYPMTDDQVYKSAVGVVVNGIASGRYELPDDPADHRGVLSWNSQPQDGKLREAGSYGYRIEAPLGPQALQAAFAAREVRLRLEVSDALPGGLALYGEKFGRYPMDILVAFRLK